MIDGCLPTTYYVSNGHQLHPEDGAVIDERIVALHVNGRELASFMCSPVDVEALVLGFLRSEGLIEQLADVAVLTRSPSGSCVDVWLRHEVAPAASTIRTAGCGGGFTFDDLTALHPILSPGPILTIQSIIDRYSEMRAAEHLYPVARGVHASALCAPDRLLLLGEDVGRHNTVDKLWGQALLQGVEPAGNLIVTTGRISSEMLGKAAKMGVAVVASRTSPTSRSLALARAWKMTVVGYIRRTSLRVYTGIERIETPSEKGEERERKKSLPEGDLPR